MLKTRITLPSCLHVVVGKISQHMQCLLQRIWWQSFALDYSQWTQYICSRGLWYWYFSSSALLLSLWKRLSSWQLCRGTVHCRSQLFASTCISGLNCIGNNIRYLFWSSFAAGQFILILNVIVSLMCLFLLEQRGMQMFSKSRSSSYSDGDLGLILM